MELSTLTSVPSIGGRRPLRILSVSSATQGGLGQSQRELNTLLRSVGVETMTLADTEQGSSITRFLHEQLRDASLRFADTPLIGESATWLRSFPGRRASEDEKNGPGQPVLLSPALENALPDIAVSFRPDIVIGTSLNRATWRTIQQTCRSLHIPTALFLHSESALRHLAPRKGQIFQPDDLVLANSHSLVAAAAAFRTRAHFISPVVDVRAARADTTRERILLINPRFGHGLELLGELADHFRTIEFVLQESWTLTAEERHIVDSILAHHPNVSARQRVTSPAEVFRDAAILLAPHHTDHQPRVIREAQCNGIPVIASNLPGLVESVGAGGIIASDQHQWFDAINRLWQNPTTYRSYQKAAHEHARRDEVQPQQILSTLLGLVQGTIGYGRRQSVDIDLT